MPKPALFVTVSTPWAVRNYFHTGIVAELSKRANIIALATPLLADALRREGWSATVRIEEWDSGPEPRMWRLGRQLRKKMYMEVNRVHTEAIWKRYARRPLYQRVAGPMISLATRLVGQRGLRAAQRADLLLNHSDAFGEVFREAGRGVLFATHADTYFEEAVLRSAKRNGIEAALMVLSWDHLSTKVVLSPDYERILVWTDLQRDEVLASYRNYKPEQVVVVGIPHYDLYYRPSATTREEWCRRHSLDPDKRTLVFYSMPQVRHDTQHAIVERLAEAAYTGSDLPGDVQILVKCHPWDDPAVYASIPARYPNVKIYATDLGANATPSDWIPDKREIEISRDCLAFADVTCNIYSTVTIEAALFDKPVVHVAFDAGPLAPGRVPCREYYNFTHFKPIVDMAASPLAYSQEALHSLIARALSNPGERAEQRRALAARFLGPMDGRSSERVVAELTALLPDAAQDAAPTIRELPPASSHSGPK